MKKLNNVTVGIYKITNPKGKIYIGQSVNIEKRFRKYKYLDEKNKQTKLYNSFKKYGMENHTFEIIEVCDISLLDEREIYWGEYYNVLLEEGLNCRLGDGKGKLSEETKKKISKIHKGREYSEEWKQKISSSKIGGNGYPKGIKRPKEFGEHLSKVLKGISKIPKGTPKPNGFNSHLSKPILQLTLNGEIIKEWESINQASKTLNIDHTGISKVANGKYKTAYGFRWKFKEGIES